MPKQLIHALLGLFVLCASLTPPVTRAEDVPLATIAALDVPRYMGRWYEVAKYPNRFQKKCAGNTSAEYSQQPDGTLKVINRCRTSQGEWEEAVGAARQVGDTASAKLKVRFAPAWLSFIPAVWGNYWIIDIDPEYQLVAISEPRREYLWVLSRTPTVSGERRQALLERLRAMGFDLDKLESTTHHADR